ncbi:hypothetical protein LMG24238_03002 [Paraburkholderia sediminicola]|uniref:Uncharacterized protein n=1 Tax=Paraburkholderia sediminicola TaxID=458836 RepID=A0A6J5B2V0_9BURK|nr:hypothetical protein [Paraburkholderia sediminicola]CAB3688762.1 hypothetical protein LMG24238_03002 [Paraburkholderia sediminicola]
MTAGFQAFTDSGLFQIDGQTPNYQLTASLVQTLRQESIPTVYNNVGQQFYATYWHTTFSFTATNPLFAFVADGNVMVTPWKFSKTGSNTYTAEFIGAGQANVTLFIFDKVAPSGSRFGLQVFDNTGALIADAVSPFARVLDVKSGAYLSGSGFDGTGTSMPGAGTQSQDYGRPVAIAGCFPAHYMSNSGDGTGETTMSGIAVSGGVVTWEFHTFNGTRGSHYVGFREASAWRFMVLDMTGII